MKISDLISTDKQFKAELKEYRGRAASMDKDTHGMLCSTMLLTEVKRGGDGDPSRIRDMLESMPKGSRLEAACKWLRDFAPLAISTSNGKITVKMLKGKQAASHAGWNLAKAVRTPYWVHVKPEKKIVDVTAQQMVQRFINSFKGAMEGKGNKRLTGDAEVAERLLAGIQKVATDTLAA